MTTTPGSLERAVQIAAQVHAGARDKGGSPYLLHPLRVMLRLQDPVAQIVAMLHDVLEDGGPEWSCERLSGEGFGEEVLQALRAVTKTADKQDQFADSPDAKVARYLVIVRRAKARPVGCLVKLADPEDNLDTSRLPQPLSAKDEFRLSKYRVARELLQAP